MKDEGEVVEEGEVLTIFSHSEFWPCRPFQNLQKTM